MTPDTSSDVRELLEHESGQHTTEDIRARLEHAYEPEEIERALQHWRDQGVVDQDSDGRWHWTGPR